MNRAGMVRPRPAAADPGSGAALDVEPTGLWDEPAARGWHRVVFCMVAAGWAPVALVAWLAVAVAGFGWEGHDRFGGPTIVSSPTGAAVLSVGMATVMFAIGAVVLFAMAHWAIPIRRARSNAVATVAWLWAPAAVTVWLLLR